MTITTNIEKTARTARHTAKMQRDSYEAMAKNFSALQRRNVEFAQMWMTGGFELMRAYQSFFSPFSYAQQGLKAAQQTTQHTQHALQATQQVLQATQQELRVAEEATAKAEQATVQAEQATVKAEKAAEKTTAKAEKAAAKAEKAAAKAEKAVVNAEQATEKATVKAEKAEKVTAKVTANTQAATREAALRDEEENREAALQAAVRSSLKTKDYDELNVDEVSKKLDGLSATELNKVREYEQHNKNRETLVEQIDRKIKATA